MKILMLIALMGGSVCGLSRAETAPLAPLAMPIPVFKGIDPLQIPMTDEVRTQIVPLTNIQVGAIKAEFAPLMGNDVKLEEAKDKGNVLIFTGSSIKIRRLVEILQSLDAGPVKKEIQVERRLLHANSGDAARLLNAMFAPGGAGRGVAVGPPAGGRGAAAGRVRVAPRLYADSDVKTNTVILVGPAQDVADALKMLDKVEEMVVDEMIKKEQE